MAKKKKKKKTTKKPVSKKKPVARRKKAVSRRKKAAAPRFRKSKTEGFLEKIREDNSMIEYMTKLRVMNPAATLTRQLNEPRREGGFVRLAHANEEFTAPVLTKGKSVFARENRRE